ncbi:MAG: DUF1043 family protein [Gammaproteobacteria bacterium]|nr:DUF1043 family protein [Gammaproteobacteria bacterium]
MIFLSLIAGLAVGVIIGVLFASRVNGGSRVQELENQIHSLKENHGEYRDSVSDHFAMTAELVQHMTESYKEVYQHLASGAQDLCSHEVASKLLPAESDAVFESNGNQKENGGLIPPKDYAAKQNPEQKGALSEEFGLEKTKPESEDQPVSETKPESEDQPESEDLPESEARPESEAKPESEDLPESEDKSVGEDLPVSENRPMSKDKPVSEDRPVS